MFILLIKLFKIHKSRIDLIYIKFVLTRLSKSLLNCLLFFKNVSLDSKLSCKKYTFNIVFDYIKYTLIKSQRLIVNSL